MLQNASNEESIITLFPPDYHKYLTFVSNDVDTSTGGRNIILLYCLLGILIEYNLASILGKVLII